MVFNVGNQRAEIMNNVAGNQYLAGSQTVSGMDTQELVELVAQVRAGVDGAGLRPQDAAAARHDLDEVQNEIHSGTPDLPRVAGRLTRITQVLASVGALAAAGAGLISPLTALAGWLGSLGDPIRQMLAP